MSVISLVPLLDLNEYGVLVACEQTAEYAAYLDLFQRIRYEQHRRKGILRMRL